MGRGIYEKKGKFLGEEDISEGKEESLKGRGDQ